MIIATDDLEVNCPACKGEGVIKADTCHSCSGKGVILTSQGQTLLHFIKKHIDKE
ncbi:tryptophan RNA-binding attenuation protein [Metabacillus arenae]|uniref:Tryptophan RNA-binding attenuation protein n=1 Tax=Metabacillus arenae TaxID=2771434 RepID=A0A926NMH7_9BACI|nr:tryptophan RNA-binding attenuation protein [Metabacillus arenae]MBD1383353.1 tryptophan RNA-binding attenuation protein [Metabacillus arenae]